MTSSTATVQAMAASLPSRAVPTPTKQQKKANSLLADWYSLEKSVLVKQTLHPLTQSKASDAPDGHEHSWPDPSVLHQRLKELQVTFLLVPHVLAWWMVDRENKRGKQCW